LNRKLYGFAPDILHELTQQPSQQKPVLQIGSRRLSPADLSSCL
jgi:hypothetical protein